MSRSPRSSTSAPPIYRGRGPHPALRTSSLFQLDDEEREILVAIKERDDGDDDDPPDEDDGSTL